MRALRFFAKTFSSPRAPIAGVAIAAVVAVTGGAAYATRTAGDHFADAAFEKIGGGKDSSAVLDAIADKVVEKITKNGGTLDAAQKDLVDELAKMAGKKFDKVDSEKLIDDMRGQVVKAGLGKLDGISVDEIVAQVTTALIAQASKQIENVDVEALAKDALADVVKSLDLEKLVKQKIDSLDVEKIVNDAIAKHLAESTDSNPLSWLTLLTK